MGGIKKIDMDFRIQQGQIIGETQRHFGDNPPALGRNQFYE